MENQELIILRNRFLLGIGIIIVFAIPIFFIFKNKIIMNENQIDRIKKDKENALILVVENNCQTCQKYEKIAKKSIIPYYKINKDKEKGYESMLNELEMSSYDLIPPSIIYIEEGNVSATLIDIKDLIELEEFLKNYGLLE